MSTKDSRALRLFRNHSLAELEAMLHRVQADPVSQANGTNGLYILTQRAVRLCDDITWAMYYHRRPQGNTTMETPVAEPGKNW